MVQLVGSTATSRPTSGLAQAPPSRGARSQFAPTRFAPPRFAPPRFTLTLTCVFALLTTVAGGCRSRAYQEVYVEKLTGEIRMLEDQLNEADYTNEVLRQKLARYEAREPRSSSERMPAEGGAAEGAGDDELDIRIEQNGTPDAASDVELDIDLGEPLAPDDTSGDRDGADSDDLPAPRDAYPPVQPLPPRAGEFETPPIELGEPLPPGEPDDDPALPPGQIPTPESARMLFPGIPATVAIHAGLSGRHHHDSDDVEDGIFLVLTVADADGRPIRCEQPVSVVVLDPAQTGEAARLGRWDFTAQEVNEQFRETPLPSIQLPILWQEARPSGDSVAVFVRVMTDAERPLETDMLMEFQAGSAAEWTSRGLGTHAAQITPENAWR